MNFTTWMAECRDLLVEMYGLRHDEMTASRWKRIYIDSVPVPIAVEAARVWILNSKRTKAERIKAMETADRVKRDKRLTALVFVYGSLKRGCGNHHVLGSSVKVADAVTLGRYSMRSGGFPVVLKSNPNGRVTGEVYRVGEEILERLDRLEGNGAFYLREMVDLELADGSFASAWMYVGMDQSGAVWGKFFPVAPVADRLTWVLPEWLSVKEEEDDVVLSMSKKG